MAAFVEARLRSISGGTFSNFFASFLVLEFSVELLEAVDRGALGVCIVVAVIKVLSSGKSEKESTQFSLPVGLISDSISSFNRSLISAALSPVARAPPSISSSSSLNGGSFFLNRLQAFLYSI